MRWSACFQGTQLGLMQTKQQLQNSEGGQYIFLPEPVPDTLTPNPTFILRGAQRGFLVSLYLESKRERLLIPLLIYTADQQAIIR